METGYWGQEVFLLHCSFCMFNLIVPSSLRLLLSMSCCFFSNERERLKPMRMKRWRGCCNAAVCLDTKLCFNLADLSHTEYLVREEDTVSPQSAELKLSLSSDPVKTFLHKPGMSRTMSGGGLEDEVMRMQPEYFSQLTKKLPGNV